MLNRSPATLALILCALFVLLGLPWIDRPGIQTDEALFAGGIYPPFDERLTMHLAGRQYPIMVMPYVGALKAGLWSLIFRLWPPSPASVRIPALLLGALTIWWVFRLLSLTNGLRAALAATALLATDPIYLQYSRFDHGPVVIQHLCLTGAMLALLRFARERRARWLAAGFFILGLGIWEKAIFAWLIAGLVLAALVLHTREIRELTGVRAVTLAAAAFAAGAAPLILYNLREPLATFRGNTIWSTEGFAGKAHLLGAVLEGDALFGSMIREPWDGPPVEPPGFLAKAVVAISRAAGSPRRSLMAWLAAASFLLLPFVWRTSGGATARFALIAGSAAWLQMACIKGAGGGAHHTILIWPLPAIAIAAVLAAAAARVRYGPAILAAIVAIACVSNLLVLSTYGSNLLRFGGTASWTDAMYPAFDAIHAMDKQVVCAIDWGFLDTLRMFERDATVCLAADPADEAGRLAARFQLVQPGYVFLTHTAGNESFPGITERFLGFAASEGFEPVHIRLFADSNGRQTVETFQFQVTTCRPNGKSRRC